MGPKNGFNSPLFVWHLQSTVLDFEPYITTVVFTPGCVFRCPFCFNTDIVLDQTGISYTPNDIFRFLDKTNNSSRIIDAVCISGGEPLMHNGKLVEFSAFLKSEGYKVKIDTTLCGGSIRPLLPHLDGVALSIKDEAQLSDKHFLANLKMVDDAEMERRELRIVLTKDNLDSLTETYTKLVKNTEIFTAKKWLLKIGKAIKEEKLFEPFNELQTDELYLIKDSWKYKGQFKRVIP